LLELLRYLDSIRDTCLIFARSTNQVGGRDKVTSAKIEKILESHDLAEFKGLFDESMPSLRLTFSEDKAEQSVSRAGGRPLLPVRLSVAAQSEQDSLGFSLPD
jgi:hypothetical protein